MGLGYQGYGACTEYSPYYLYFNQTLRWHHGSVAQDGSDQSRPDGYSSEIDAHDYVRPENRAAAVIDRSKIRNITHAEVEARVDRGRLPWGSPDNVADHLIRLADHAGAHAIVLNLNFGALPHELIPRANPPLPAAMFYQSCKRTR